LSEQLRNDIALAMEKAREAVGVLATGRQAVEEGRALLQAIATGTEASEMNIAVTGAAEGIGLLTGAISLIAQSSTSINTYVEQIPQSSISLIDIPQLVQSDAVDPQKYTFNPDQKPLDPDDDRRTKPSSTKSKPPRHLQPCRQPLAL
jgi:hypothetical protein